MPKGKWSTGTVVAIEGDRHRMTRSGVAVVVEVDDFFPQINSVSIVFDRQAFPFEPTEGDDISYMSYSYVLAEGEDGYYDEAGEVVEINDTHVLVDRTESPYLRRCGGRGLEETCVADAAPDPVPINAFDEIPEIGDYVRWRTESQFRKENGESQ